LQTTVVISPYFKVFMMKKLLIYVALGSALLSSVAQAVPWCHRGTIVQIADVNWSQSQIMANFTGSVPGSVTDAEIYKTFTATANYANNFVGGGGGFGGYSVINSGHVRVIVYAPYTYTNMVGPGYYFTSQGVKFKLEKCYTIAPMTHHLEVAEFNIEDGSGIDFKPLRGLGRLPHYWQSPITDPDDDDGKRK
jgi:hypothetical protein